MQHLHGYSNFDLTLTISSREQLEMGSTLSAAMILYELFQLLELQVFQAITHFFHQLYLFDVQGNQFYL